MSVAMSVCPSALPCQVPAPRFQFPLDADGRIQGLFHDACVCAATPARARRVSRKLSRYAAYLSRVSVPAARAQLYAQWQRAKRISLIHAPTPENVAARQALVGPFRAAHAQCVEADAAHAQCVEAVAKVRARVRAIAALRARA